MISGEEKDEDNTRTYAGDPAFNQRVLMFLRNQLLDSEPIPNYGNDYINPTGSGIPVTLFNRDTDQTTVYIFTPVKYTTDPQSSKEMEDDNNLEYQARFGAAGEVKATIDDLLAPHQPRTVI